jgi:hypothetical protein
MMGTLKYKNKGKRAAHYKVQYDDGSVESKVSYTWAKNRLCQEATGAVSYLPARQPPA